jgi:4-carboxymuconolactone decarboxylase
MLRRLSAVLWVLIILGLSARAQLPLPSDVFPASGSRLPVLDAPGPTDAVAAIRQHGSGVIVRWESPLGRALTELAILVSAREHDQPYEWSLHEMEALAVGLDPTVIDRVRYRMPLTGLGEKESIIIEMGREIFGTFQLSSETYARALNILGTNGLVDIIDLIGNYTATGTRLTAVNQQMPLGWKQFLPLPFALPDDIHPDSRSRLPLQQVQEQGLEDGPAPAPTLYSRTMAPAGTGPGHIRLHGAGLDSLEASVGRGLVDLAILVTAREHNAQYQWTMNELRALRDGLEPAIIDQVRHRGPVTALGEREAVLIEFGRELFGMHNVSARTYARALESFGERDLVDFIDLMARHSGDAVLLTAFDQHLPEGQRPLLPIP